MIVFFCSWWLLFCKERKRRTKATVAGDILDAIDRGYELVMISNDGIQDLGLFLLITERDNSMKIVIRANLRHANNLVKKSMLRDPRNPVPHETKNV